jgi:hypothetical protein
MIQREVSDLTGLASELPHMSAGRQEHFRARLLHIQNSLVRMGVWGLIQLLIGVTVVPAACLVLALLVFRWVLGISRVFNAPGIRILLCCSIAALLAPAASVLFTLACGTRVWDVFALARDAGTRYGNWLARTTFETQADWDGVNAILAALHDGVPVAYSGILLAYGGAGTLSLVTCILSALVLLAARYTAAHSELLGPGVEN